MDVRPSDLSVLELCAGGGGQALGLERAGFRLEGAIELDKDACQTLRDNRPGWRVLRQDLCTFDALPFRGVDLIAAGVPCPPFSIAGKQEGADDERDLFPAALSVIEQAQPSAVLFENVRNLMARRFTPYRQWLLEKLRRAGFTVLPPTIVNAVDFGVPQWRTRVILVAFKDSAVAERFTWPSNHLSHTTVGQVLFPFMSSMGWPGARRWSERANRIAPTLVGGSKKHGGPDLGPRRAKTAWENLWVDPHGIANAPPGQEFPEHAKPKLTLEMAAAIQGFPPRSEWRFAGTKTAAYRQVGNALPPPVADAIGISILAALRRGADKRAWQIALPGLEGALHA